MKNGAFFLAWCLLSLLAAAPVPAERGTPALLEVAQPRPFEDVAGWSQRFDAPGRDTWQKPEEVLRALALPPRAVVADIGAGTGYFAVRFARALPEATVYAVDIEPEMVSHLAERARREGLLNVKAVQAARDDPRLPEAVDLAFMVNVYQAIRNRDDYFARLRSKLKPGGRVVVIGSRSDAPVGPPGDFRVSSAAVKAEMLKAGYEVADEHDFLPFQYFLVFRTGKRERTSR
jgi:SAM-dependent methyltransferase